MVSLKLQLFALAFVPKAPALLSLVSSGYVILEILRFPERRTRLYHRIVLCMNISQGFMACSHFVGTWAIPSGTPGVVGAVGNDITCKIQGALLTCPGFSVSCYYTSLSIISYIAVKNDFQEKHHKHLEPMIHLFSIGVPLILTVIGLKKNFFNPAGSWCWVDSYPSGCEKDLEVDCVHQVESYYRILLVAFMYTLSILTLTMITLIYRKIKRDEKSIESSSDPQDRGRPKKSRIVFVQISLYVLSYVITYILIFISRVIQWTTGKLSVPIFSVAIFLVALQGFLNMIVYIMLRNSARYRFNGDNIEMGQTSTEEENETHESTVQTGSNDQSRYEFSIFEGTRPSAEIWNDANEVIPVASVSYVNAEE